MAMISISETYQACVGDIPVAIQKKEIAVGNREPEILCVGFERLK
jgi:hypothetical protein